MAPRPAASEFPERRSEVPELIPKNMAQYYVNKNPQPNGDHEVHKQDCAFLPLPENRIYLGYFAYCSSAVAEARKYYRQVNGCYFCSRPCHTS